MGNHLPFLMMQTTPQILTTERLMLRPVAPGDGPQIAALAGDRDLARMTARIPHPYDEADAKQFIDRSDGKLARAIQRHTDLIGMIGFDLRTDGQLEIGYWIGKPYWGHGYATESAVAMIDRAFSDPLIQEIHAGYFVDNPASGRIQEKLGFLKTGTSTLESVARGEDVPTIRMELTRVRWRARSAP